MSTEFSRPGHWRKGSLSLLQGIFPTPGIKPRSPELQQILYQLSHTGSPRILKWVAYPFSSRSSQTRDQIKVSCIAGRFFTNWVIREALPTENKPKTIKKIAIRSSVQVSSVTQSCPTLCNPMDSSMPGLPVHHQLPELTQTHVHWVSDTIQPCHPLLFPSPPAFNPSQHQGV